MLLKEVEKERHLQEAEDREWRDVGRCPSKVFVDDDESPWSGIWGKYPPMGHLHRGLR